MKNKLPISLLLLFFATTLLCTGCQSFRLFKTPNVLIILIDDVALTDLGFSNKTTKGQSHTPNIDLLRKQGVLFTNAYVSAVREEASTASILTGESPFILNYEYGTEGLDKPLSKDFKLLPEYFPYFYTSSFIGKWNVGGYEQEEFRPYNRGFKEFTGFIGNGSSYYPWYMKKLPCEEDLELLKLYSENPYYKQAKKASELYDHIKRWKELSLAERHQARSLLKDVIFSLQEFNNYNDIGFKELSLPQETVIFCKKEGYKFARMPLTKYMTDEITDQAVEFINKNDSNKKCWVSIVSYSAMHSPIEPDPEKEKLFKDQRQALISSVDDGVGKIISALRKTNQYRNTIIFFAGKSSASRKLLTTPSKLRGGKGTLFEGGLKVPLLFVWHGKVPQNIENTSLVSLQDIVPTILTETDNKHKFKKFNNLLSCVNDKSYKPRDQITWRMGSISAIRKDNWKLIKIAPLFSQELFTTKVGKTYYLLFDIKNDPYETTNLIDIKNDIARKLKKELYKSSYFRSAYNMPKSIYWEQRRRYGHLNHFYPEHRNNQNILNMIYLKRNLGDLKLYD